jgi:hypothetical protein
LRKVVTKANFNGLAPDGGCHPPPPQVREIENHCSVPYPRWGTGYFPFFLFSRSSGFKILHFFALIPWKLRITLWHHISAVN